MHILCRTAQAPTLMGSPVFMTLWPLTRPSVVSIAMVRTVFSPRCWATSSTSLWVKPSTVQGCHDRRQLSIELDIHDGTDDLQKGDSGLIFRVQSRRETRLLQACSRASCNPPMTLRRGICV